MSVVTQLRAVPPESTCVATTSRRCASEFSKGITHYGWTRAVNGSLKYLFWGHLRMIEEVNILDVYSRKDLWIIVAPHDYRKVSDSLLAGRQKIYFHSSSLTVLGWRQYQGVTFRPYSQWKHLSYPFICNRVKFQVRCKFVNFAPVSSEEESKERFKKSSSPSKVSSLTGMSGRGPVW